MAAPPTPGIRETLLKLVHEMETMRQGGNLQQNTLLDRASEVFGTRQGNQDLEQAILTQWQELFRTGLLSWGYNLGNPNPPFFHLTERGRTALANASRDPSNPAGYLKHLETLGTLQDVTYSYLAEGLECYVAGLYKAAVMVGAAAESIVLNLATAVDSRFQHDEKPIPKDLNDWRIRTVTTELEKFFDANINKKTHRELYERYEAFWSAFTRQLRLVRNDAGHPTSIDPVTPDAVHSALLVFPELARLADALFTWVIDDEFVWFEPKKPEAKPRKEKKA